MKIEKDYLTASEIRHIAELMLSLDKNDYMTREYIKVLLIADFCTDIKLPKEDDEIVFKEEIYNKMWEDGDVKTLYSEIKNWYLIDDMVRNKENIYTLIKDKLDEISKSINEVKVEDIISSFSKELISAKDLIEEKK